MANQHDPFEKMLTGGHPNSLGNTIEVVALILADQSKLGELYRCYFSKDEVVRLRTSNAFKRICKEHNDWLIPYIDPFLNEISKINQPSAQWTLAQLFEELSAVMTTSQLEHAKEILKYNLTHYTDWIVLNTTMQTLSDWAKKDEKLKTWLLPNLLKLSNDERKSVAGRAKKLIKLLS